MNVGYNPVRQPLRVAPPVNLPSNYGMVDKQADIQMAGQMASILSQFAPTMMKLGVELRLSKEGREGYTKEMNNRSMEDNTAFKGLISKESTELNADLSGMTNKEEMSKIVNKRLQSLKDRVIGVNSTPLIRDKHQQEKFLKYIDSNLRPQWEGNIYAKELDAREKADYASFQATVAQETVEFNADLSRMTDKDMMEEAVNVRIENLRNKVIGANGQVPLIRNKNQQDKFLKYVDTVVRPNWKSGVYTRVGAIDAENTKAKANNYIDIGVNHFSPEMIKDGVLIKQNAGLITPEQAKLEIEKESIRAESIDLSRITNMVASGNRAIYLSGLGITEEEAESKGLTNDKLATMFGEKMIKRVESGVYKYTASDDLNRAIADIHAGIESVEIKQNTAMTQRENAIKKQNQVNVYNGIEQMAELPDFAGSAPKMLGNTLSIIDPDLSETEVAKTVDNFIKASGRKMTDRDWYNYNALLVKTAEYSPSKDPTGKKAAKLYNETLRTLPPQQAHDVIQRLDKSIRNVGLGNMNQQSYKMLEVMIHKKFEDSKLIKRLGKDAVGADAFKATVGASKNESISWLEAQFKAEIFAYIDRNQLNLQEATTYIQESPLYKHLDQIDTLRQYNDNLQFYSNPNPYRGIPETSDYEQEINKWKAQTQF